MGEFPHGIFEIGLSVKGKRHVSRTRRSERTAPLSGD
jgi:hypothetical protein